MNWQDKVRHLAVRLNVAERRAFIYLERQGFRFCMHFGTHNCVQYARDIRRWRKHGAKAKPGWL